MARLELGLLASRVLTQLLATAALAALLGCGESEVEPLPDGGAWEMELGKGGTAFEPLADGEELAIDYGGQGGSHVYVSFRMRDLHPERVLAEVTTTFEAYPDQTYHSRRRVDFVREAGDGENADAGAGQPDAYVYALWPAQLPDSDVGQPTRIDVLLVDRNGRWARESKTIVPAAEDF